MPTRDRWAHCRYCGTHKSLKPLSRNGSCIDCARERAIAYVESVHPGGVVPPGGMQTDDDGEQLTIQQTG